MRRNREVLHAKLSRTARALDDSYSTRTLAAVFAVLASTDFALLSLSFGSEGAWRAIASASSIAITLPVCAWVAAAYRVAKRDKRRAAEEDFARLLEQSRIETQTRLDTMDALIRDAASQRAAVNAAKSRARALSGTLAAIPQRTACPPRQLPSLNSAMGGFGAQPR